MNRIYNMARWDGGPLEVAKGILSGWYYMPYPESIYACTNWYNKDTIELLKKANINWIWVTWSNGFSLKEEMWQRKILKEYIEECHKYNIKVIAYMSMTNIFWEEMFKSEPASKDWIQIDEEGKPVPYGAAYYINEPTRYLACLNHPSWQEYLLRRLDIALDANLDGIMYDNQWTACYCYRCKEEFKKFTKEQFGQSLELPSYKEITEGEERVRIIYWKYMNYIFDKIYAFVYNRVQNYNPKFFIYGNFNSLYGTFALPHNNVISTEDGIEPGIIDGKLVTNIGLLKCLYGASKGIMPIGVEYARGRGRGKLEKFIPSRGVGSSRFTPMEPIKHKLSMAEAAAYGASYEITPEGYLLNDLFFNKPESLENWETIASYNKFFLEHKFFFTNMEPLDFIGVLLNDGIPMKGNDFHRIKLLSQLGIAKIPFGVIYDKDLNSELLSRYQVLLLPNTKILTDQQISIISEYAKRGHKIIATGETGIYDERLVPRRTSLLKEIEGIIWLEDPIISNSNNLIIDKNRLNALLSKLEEFCNSYPIRMEAPTFVIPSIWKCKKGKIYIHILNYSDTPVNNLKIKVHLPFTKAFFYSPEGNPIRINLLNSEILLPELVIYGIIKLE